MTTRLCIGGTSQSPMKLLSKSFGNNACILLIELNANLTTTTLNDSTAISARTNTSRITPRRHALGRRWCLRRTAHEQFKMLVRSRISEVCCTDTCVLGAVVKFCTSPIAPQLAPKRHLPAIPNSSSSTCNGAAWKSAHRKRKTLGQMGRVQVAEYRWSNQSAHSARPCGEVRI